jgi:hypothetical protein
MPIFSELFPLTDFFRAFRSVNLYRANWDFITGDLTALAAGALVAATVREALCRTGL